MRNFMLLANVQPTSGMALAQCLVLRGMLCAGLSMPGLMLRLHLPARRTHGPFTIQLPMQRFVLSVPFLMPRLMLRADLVVESTSFCIQLAVQCFVSLITVIHNRFAVLTTRVAAARGAATIFKIDCERALGLRGGHRCACQQNCKKYARFHSLLRAVWFCR